MGLGSSGLDLLSFQKSQKDRVTIQGARGTYEETRAMKQQTDENMTDKNYSGKKQ